MINQLVRYFDQMAEIICRIKEEEVYREKDFASLLYDKNNQIYMDLLNSFPKMINDDRSFKNLTLGDIDDDFFLNIEEELQKENVALLHLLLYYMDHAIEDCYMQMTGFEDDVVICDALNTNCDDTGIIVLKNVGCKWGMRQIGSVWNGILQNFYCIEKNNLNGMQIKNYILDYQSILKGRKGRLKLAVSPITKKKTVEFSAPYTWVNARTGSLQKCSG